jgi:hypothetical protein
MHNSAKRSRFRIAQPNEPRARAQSPRPTKSGVPGSTRTSTGRALDAFPLPLGYRHETAQPGFARSATTGTRLLGTCPPKLQRRRVEDQAGFEPAVGMRQRIKSPLPLHSGLRLRVRIQHPLKMRCTVKMVVELVSLVCIHVMRGNAVKLAQTA